MLVAWYWNRKRLMNVMSTLRGYIVICVAAKSVEISSYFIVIGNLSIHTDSNPKICRIDVLESAQEQILSAASKILYEDYQHASSKYRCVDPGTTLDNICDNPQERFSRRSSEIAPSDAFLFIFIFKKICSVMFFLCCMYVG